MTGPLGIPTGSGEPPFIPTRFPASRGGRIRSCEGLLMAAEGLEAAVGALVEVESAQGALQAEVVGFRDHRLLLMALGRQPVDPGARCWLRGARDEVIVGPRLLGRVTDAMGQALDGLGPILGDGVWPLAGRPVPALSRSEVTQAMPTGVKGIDALLTLGRGQRVGLMAGSGVGKSVLMQQLVKGAEADAVVVGLIGERGREISGFITEVGTALSRAHIVAVPADEPAPLRVRGAFRAFAIAEDLRARGQHVLLILDSLTRVAHGQRDISLAAGEPVGLRGYPPSSLGLIPRLVERAGNDAKTGGAITLVATVLADGDDTVSDPVVDTARGVLDGHIILDRSIAARGRYPAIDFAYSISRTMSGCTTPAHAKAAAALRRDLALVEANQDLVAMGAYSRGQDLALDRAMDRRPQMEALLGQGREERVDYQTTLEILQNQWGAA